MLCFVWYCCFIVFGKLFDVVITHTTYGLRVFVFLAGPGASRKAESAWVMHREGARGSEGDAEKVTDKAKAATTTTTTMATTTTTTMATTTTTSTMVTTMIETTTTTTT